MFDYQGYPYQFEDNDMADRLRKNLLTLLGDKIEDIESTPRNYLEIGVYQGRSGCWVLDVLLKHQESVYVGIDINFQPEAYTNLSYHGKKLGEHKNRVNLLRGNSRYVLPWIDSSRILPHVYDWIYIDGDHTRIACYWDIVNSWELLVKGGLLICDDYREYEHYGVIEAVSKFKHNYKGMYEEVLVDNWQCILRKT